MEKHHVVLVFLTLPQIRKKSLIIRQPLGNHYSSLLISPLTFDVQVWAQRPRYGLVCVGPTYDVDVCSFSFPDTWAVHLWGSEMWSRRAGWAAQTSRIRGVGGGSVVTAWPHRLTSFLRLWFETWSRENLCLLKRKPGRWRKKGTIYGDLKWWMLAGILSWTSIWEGGRVLPWSDGGVSYKQEQRVNWVEREMGLGSEVGRPWAGEEEQGENESREGR